MILALDDSSTQRVVSSRYETVALRAGPEFRGRIPRIRNPVTSFEPHRRPPMSAALGPILRREAAFSP